MKFNKKVTKFVEKNVYDDLESQNIFKLFYDEFYFRTTDELKMYRSIIKSKMVKGNSIAILLSLVALIFSFSTALIDLFKDLMEKETKTAAVIGIVFLLGVFIAAYIIFFIIDGMDISITGKHKKMSLMIEAIDKILSERKENNK